MSPLGKPVDTNTTRRLKESRATGNGQPIFVCLPLTMMDRIAKQCGKNSILAYAILETSRKLQFSPEWFKTHRSALASLTLPQPQFSAAVAKLEEKGFIEVRRSPGRKNHYRMINGKDS